MQVKIKYYNPRIQWPDWQGRIYKRSGNLMWDGKVHERIVGYNNYAVLPEKYFLIHEKTMDKQIEQNLYYEKIQQRRNI